MSASEIGDLVGRILAMIFLAVACAGGVWAIVEFIVFNMRWRRGRKKRKNDKNE